MISSYVSQGARRVEKDVAREKKKACAPSRKSLSCMGPGGEVYDALTKLCRRCFELGLPGVAQPPRPRPPQQSTLSAQKLRKGAGRTGERVVMAAFFFCRGTIDVFSIMRREGEALASSSALACDGERR